MLAMEMGAPNSLIQLLFQSGADPHHSDRRGQTVLRFTLNNQNIWAMKWLVAENVELTAPIGDLEDLRTASEHLLGCCEYILIHGDADFTRVLNYLRAMEVLAVAWTNNVGDSFSIKQTQAQLIERLNSFIPKSIEFSKARSSRTYNMVEEELHKFCDIVHMLTDMLSNPLSLRHLCRVQIRRLLGRDFRKKLNQLNVPLPLQLYLRVYKESDILL